MGQSKRQMEYYVDKICTCGEGCVLAYKEHSKSCPARKYLKEAFGIVEETFKDEVWRMFSPIGFMMSLILLQNDILLGKFGGICLDVFFCFAYAYIFAIRYTRYHHINLDYNFLEGFDNW